MALPELLPQLGTEQIWDVLTEKMSVKAPSLVPCSPQSSKLNVNCASLLCARCLGDLRCKEWPLSSEGPWPRHHPPSGDTRVGGGCLELLGISRVGRSPVLSALECGGCSAVKSCGEGARILGVGWHL